MPPKRNTGASGSKRPAKAGPSGGRAPGRGLESPAKRVPHGVLSSPAASTSRAGPSIWSSAVRAQSPGAAASLATVKAQSAHMLARSGDKTRVEGLLNLAQRAPIVASASVGEVLGCLPAWFRDVVRPHFLSAMKARKNVGSITGQLVKLRAHQTQGTFPPMIAVKAPTVQFVKDFIVARPNVSQAFDSATLQFKQDCLTELLKLKQEELDGQLALCSITPVTISERMEIDGEEVPPETRPAPLWQLMVSELQAAFDLRHQAQKVPKWDAPTADSHGRPVFRGWEEDEGVVEEYSTCMGLLPIAFHHCIDLVVDELSREQDKVEKKRQLQKSAELDVDEHINSQSIQSMVDKRVAEGVAAALKKHGLGKGKVTSSSPLTVDQLLTSMQLTIGSRRKAIGRPEGQVLGHWKRWFEAQDASWQASGKGEGQSESVRERKRPRLFLQQERKGESEGQLSGSVVDVGTSDVVAFRYDDARTYPDWLLTVPYPVACKYIVERTPVVVLESMRYRSTIHMINCELPRDLALHLSSGLKYMLPTKLDHSLIEKAWDDFVDRLRYRVRAIVLDDVTGTVNDFDPDYWVRRPREKAADPLDRAFEYGILEGGRAVAQMVSQMPKDELSTWRAVNRALAPPVAVLRSYLASHQLVVLATDKNLGCAVCPRSWIIDNTMSLLSNASDYVEITREHAYDILRRKAQHMTDLANYASVNDLHRQLPDFLTSMIPVGPSPLTKALKNLPKFYILPKIHKTPVKARPILPCHSVIQGPAGKFVSKMLKPVVKKARYVIHGSKDLALKLSKLSLPYYKSDNGVLKKLYLVSGDVVAFYPNVDTSIAHIIAYNAFEKHLADSFPENDDELNPDFEYDAAFVQGIAHQLHVFRECLAAADDELICQFEGRYFQQKRGLAMGVACSPEMANLYGDFHECLPGSVLEDSDIVPFYGRYIDDCLALVYATSEAEAISVMDKLKFANCTLEWSASDSYLTFLDMTLFFENGRLLHKPFRKPLNHFERIPWISSHPLYVKRGTFISELSRVATLSSRFDDFAEACKEVSDIYIARGYPPTLIATWLRNNYQARWDARLSETSPALADVLVLKSEYNVSWDFFNVQTLADRMKTAWTDALYFLSHRSSVRPEVRNFTGVEVPSLSPRLVRFLQEPEQSDVCTLASERLAATGAFGEFLRLDKLGLVDKRFIVSKKRAKQLGDLTALWRKSVLENRDRQASRGFDPSKGTLEWFWNKQYSTRAEGSGVVDG